MGQSQKRSTESDIVTKIISLLEESKTKHGEKDYKSALYHIQSADKLAREHYGNHYELAKDYVTMFKSKLPELPKPEEILKYHTNVMASLKKAEQKKKNYQQK